METKICSRCKKEFIATTEFWNKQKMGKYGLKSICKGCTKVENKIRRSTEDAKEKHRLEMKKRRAQNPEKYNEIAKRCREKNKDLYNLKRRERYKNDIEYREKKINIEKKYKESGRRYEMNSKPEQKEKARLRSKKRRKDETKKIHDYNRNAIWRKENREYLLNYYKLNKTELKPNYIASTMRMSIKELTPEIIETKQLIIKLKRELKNKNIKIK